MNIIIAPSYEALSEIAAQEIIDVINNHPTAVIGLATGSTPLGMYQKLIAYNKQKVVDFSKVTTFNLDEYIGIPSNHPQSYRYFMDSNFFSHININYKNTHIPNGMAEDIEIECKNYDAMLRDSGGIDIQILGIGSNGHIGFNEPSHSLIVGTHVADLAPETIKANSRFFRTLKDVPTQAITMGIGDIMKSKKIVLLANGSTKSDIIQRLVENKIDTHVPASLLQAHPNVTVIVDQLAGKLIAPTHSS